MPRNSSCTLCPLHLGTRTVCLPPRGGNLTAPRVVFVLGAPDAEDDQAGQPGSGEAGRLLDLAIKEYGIQDYAITSAVRCRPAGDRKPYVREARACAPYLAEELAAWAPRVVVPMGNVALQAVAGLDSGILRYAGRVLDCPGLPFTVFPIMDAALVLRDNSVLSTFEACFRSLRTLLDGRAVAAPKYRRLSTDEAVAEMVRIAASPDIPRWALDLETTGLLPRFNTIRTLAITTEAGKSWWTHWDERLIPALRALCLSGKTMVAHNAVFEVKWLLHHVLSRPSLDGSKNWRALRWPIRDSLLLSHLLDENTPHDLTYLSKAYTDLGGYDDVMNDALAGDPDAYAKVDLGVLGQYNAGDSDACFRLERLFTLMLSKEDAKYGPPTLAALYDEVVEPCIFTVAHCELNGRKVDRERIAALHAALEAEESSALAKMLADPAVIAFQETYRQAALLANAKRERLSALLRAAPKDEKPAWRERIAKFDKARSKPLSAWGQHPEGTFNPNSAPQVTELLFQFLKVPVLGLTDSKEPSAAEKYLRPVEAAHPFVGVFLQWKKANTLRQKYLEARIAPFVAADGYVYASYSIHGTETGRWSSSRPNMQNQAPRIKPIFVSRFPGGKIVEIDFSQLELRLIAWATQCQFMLRAYRNNEDLHKNFATVVLGRPPKDKEERKRKGKTPNFGLAYNCSARRFSLEYGVPLPEAEEMRDTWHRTNPEVAPWMTSVQRQAERTGYVKGFLGRIRRLPDARLSLEPGERDTPRAKKKVHAKMAASNFPIQNLGSELNCWAFARATLDIQQRGLRSVPLGATHDSMTFDCPADEAEEVARTGVRWMTEKVMARFPWIGVPLLADPEMGPSWGEMEPVTLAVV